LVFASVSAYSRADICDDLEADIEAALIAGNMQSAEIMAYIYCNENCF